MPSRAAAVRELFRVGLAHVGLVPQVTGKKSSDFGVIDANGDGRNGGAQRSRVRLVRGKSAE